MDNGFLIKVTEIIEENLSDETFGVSELAGKVGMSRSNLLRKIQKHTDLSVSVFIRQVRLKNAMEMLREESLNVSEVSYRVGFSSTSYFIKCFREHYGFPPGEVGKGNTPTTLDGSGAKGGFFHELKRRKVVRVISVYAATAFVTLELLSIIVEPLRLPDWTLTMGIILLSIGFVIAVVLSWIYDVNPKGGWEKTKSHREGEDVEGQPEKRGWKIASMVSFVIILVLIVLQVLPRSSKGQVSADLEKSIAVLPFTNDSNDSTNIYLINGLMESLLDNLQKIEDLRVISRTSVEKYRQNPKTSPEIARELNANYLVTGSGQKVGDQILLNIQLIEAHSDRNLWAERYKRNTGDIFELQLEVARNIVDEIEVIITPEEVEQIEKIPTQNLEAYDHYLKGYEPFQQETREGLMEAIPHFKKAVELDPDFALAHANLAISYAFLDIYQTEKIYGDLIDYHADKALLLDPKLPQSLIAKATYHNIRGEYELALPYLEKALEYHPNSTRIINILSDYYTRFVPNTEKYLEYALMGVELDITAHDSVAASYIYLHLSNALIQTGFINESEQYIAQAVEYYPDNPYTELLRIYILLAKNRDLEHTRELLLEAFEKDSQIEVLKELGVISYFMHDFESAFSYFHQLFEYTRAEGLDMYDGEKAKMGLILAELGRMEESEKYFQEFLEYAENNQSLYQGLSLAVYYAYYGDTTTAIDYMSQFVGQEKYPYWYILFLGFDDPLFENIDELPEYQKIRTQIEQKFWKYHKEIKDRLKYKDLI